MSEKPTMHCQAELDADLHYTDFIPEEIIFKWFNDHYSSSKHLLTLYGIARGLNAKTIVEVGFGRSSFILAKAAAENQGQLITCDMRDFSYLFNNKEKSVTNFIHGKSDVVWNQLRNQGIDFAFLDYFSSPSIKKDFVQKEVAKCLNLLKQNGVIAIHDTIVEKYSIREVIDSLKTNFGLIHNNAVEVLSLPYNYGLGLIRKVESSPLGTLNDTYLKKKE